MIQTFARSILRQPKQIFRYNNRRSYITDAQVRKQYQRLFTSCDLDGSGFVSFDELQSTLFRFGLANLDAKEPNLLRKTFDEAYLTPVVSASSPIPSTSSSTISTSSTSSTSNTATTTTIPQNTTTTQNQQQETDALKPEQFEIFIQRAVYLKTQYDNTLPEGTSPLWWRKFRLELRHYGSSFNLLYNQTKGAGFLLIDHGWRLSKQERKMVWVVLLDFIKTLPFAVLLAAPMGSLIVPLVARFLPSLLPSTFHTSDPNEWDKKDRTEKLVISSLEVASRILQLEKGLREVKEGSWKILDVGEKKSYKEKNKK